MRGAADATKGSGIKQALAHARAHCAPTYRDVGVMSWAFTAPYGAPRVLPDLWGTSGDGHLARPNRRARYCDFPSLIAPVVPLDANVGHLQELGILRMPLKKAVARLLWPGPLPCGQAPPPPPGAPPPRGLHVQLHHPHTQQGRAKKSQEGEVRCGWTREGKAALQTQTTEHNIQVMGIILMCILLLAT